MTPDYSKKNVQNWREWHMNKKVHLGAIF
jgi:hypothetical protein